MPHIPARRTPSTARTREGRAWYRRGARNQREACPRDPAGRGASSSTVTRGRTGCGRRAATQADTENRRDRPSPRLDHAGRHVTFQPRKYPSGLADSPCATVPRAVHDRGKHRPTGAGQPQLSNSSRNVPLENARSESARLATTVERLGPQRGRNGNPSRHLFAAPHGIRTSSDRIEPAAGMPVHRLRLALALARPGGIAGARRRPPAAAWSRHADRARSPEKDPCKTIETTIFSAPTAVPRSCSLPARPRCSRSGGSRRRSDARSAVALARSAAPTAAAAVTGSRAPRALVRVAPRRARGPAGAATPARRAARVLRRLLEAALHASAGRLATRAT